MKDYKNLIVWKRSHHLVKEIYWLTNKLPKHEQFGITSQLRRASVSIPTNIAEGCGRNSNKELHRFMVIASGSASEVEYLLYLCLEMKYIEVNSYSKISSELVEIRKMITSYRQKLI